MTDAARDADSLARLTVAGLVEALGEKTPAPGGGSVAPIVAALGAALARMVVNYSVGRKKLADHAGLHDEALAELRAMAERALELADADAGAYGELNDLMKLDKDDPKRIERWDAAVAAALAVPQEVLEHCLALLALLDRLPAATSRMLASDLAIGAILAEAAACAAAWNVRVNLPLLADPASADAIRADVARRLVEAARHRKAIESACGGEG